MTEIATQQPGQEVVQRSPAQALVAQVRSDEFKEQLAMALPDSVPPSRFQRVTVTALMQNPALAEVDRDSLFVALLRCAAVGLLPDGHEAAIVPYKGKAQLLEMIHGYRKIAGEHGWSIETTVVYAADEFGYELGDTPRVIHRPAPINSDRGPLVAAYAIGRHRDGRRIIEVYEAAQIAKAKGVAQTDRVWKQWEPQMWEKTVGKRLFAKLPLDPADKRVSGLLHADELGPAAATEMLYGPGPGEQVNRQTGEITSPAAGAPATETPSTAGDGDRPDATSPRSVDMGGPGQQAGGGGEKAADEPAAAPAPGSDDDEPEPGSEPAQTSFQVPAGVIDEAAATVVQFGAHAGKTLEQISAEKPEWITWGLRHKHRFEDEALYASLCLYVQNRLPDVWAEFEATS